MTRFHWSRVISSAGARVLTPALATITSRPPIFSAAVPDHGGNLLLIGDIAGHGIHRSALLAQFLGSGVDGFLIDVGNGHHGARRAEGLGNGQSQSLAPPVTSACFPSRENKFR